jgi:sterol 14-demethylase
MIWNLMSSTYNDGKLLPDTEIAHLMMALLLAGQHSSASISSWMLLRLASQLEIIEELRQEQAAVLGDDLKALDLQNLQLHSWVIKETMRLHSPIHSFMRKVKSPMPIDNYIVPTGHVLLAAPGGICRDATYFPDPLLTWNPHWWKEYENMRKDETTTKSIIDMTLSRDPRAVRTCLLALGDTGVLANALR